MTCVFFKDEIKIINNSQIASKQFVRVLNCMVIRMSNWERKCTVIY